MSSLLVEIVKISGILPHDNADKLEIAAVKGWYCVVAKGTFKVGEKAVYIPIDSVLGEPTLSTLFPEGSKIRPTNGRIRTIKIRGVVSQGMLARLDTLSLPYSLEVGADVAKLLNITKYEPPVEPTRLGGQTSPASRKDINPNFKKYTGIENFKNYHNVFEEGETVVITEKIHGTNFRCGWVPTATDTFLKKVKKFLRILPKYEFVYGSHNVQLTNKFIYDGFYQDQGNVYSKIVHKYDLKNILKSGQVLYGEIYGEGIQKGYTYGTKDHKLVVFDMMWDGKYLDPFVMKLTCGYNNLPTVPILYEGSFSAEKAKELTLGDSVLCPTQKVREGIVIKPVRESNHPRCGRKVLKLVSDIYLLDKTNSDHH